MRNTGTGFVVLSHHSLFCKTRLNRIQKRPSAQKIVNWITTADGCVHTADTTQLDSFVASASAVCIGLPWLQLMISE